MRLLSEFRNQIVRNLVVIGEPSVLPRAGSRNNAMNEILEAYLSYTDSVTYISSSNSRCDYKLRGVRYTSISHYSKENRLLFCKARHIKYSFANLYNMLALSGKVHVQFRVPSLYSLQLFLFLAPFLKKNNIDYSFYVAGDWYESLKFNYPKKIFIRHFLEFIQNRALKGETCVFAGDKLKLKHFGQAGRSLSFYSTTHKSIDVPSEVTNKVGCRGICFIGRIERLKNYNFFVSLAQRPELKNYNFYMFGDGPDLDLLKQKKTASGLKNLFFLGHISDRKEFDKIINSCKFFMLPSYTEGTSKTLPEMMCRSTVPIAFKGVGSNDFILGYDNGFLSKVDDINEVTEFILELEEDENRYLNILANGLEYAKRNTLDIQLERMFEFLRFRA